jgi:hypothetical protein
VVKNSEGDRVHGGMNQCFRMLGTGERGMARTG